MDSNFEHVMHVIETAIDRKRIAEQQRTRRRRFSRISRNVQRFEEGQRNEKSAAETRLLARIVQGTIANFEQQDTLTKADFERIMNEARSAESNAQA